MSVFTEVLLLGPQDYRRGKVSREMIRLVPFGPLRFSFLDEARFSFPRTAGLGPDWTSRSIFLFQAWLWFCSTQAYEASAQIATELQLVAG